MRPALLLIVIGFSEPNPTRGLLKKMIEDYCSAERKKTPYYAHLNHKVPLGHSYHYSICVTFGTGFPIIERSPLGFPC